MNECKYKLQPLYNEYNVLSKSVHEDTDHVETVNIAVPVCDCNTHNNHNILKQVGLLGKRDTGQYLIANDE